MAVCTVSIAQGQVMNQIDANGNITQVDPNNQNFNPNSHDSLHNNKEVPKGVWAWKIDRRFGDIIPTQPDTVPHLYQNSIYATGLYGEYNTIGNNFSSRLSRIFIDRKPSASSSSPIPTVSRAKKLTNFSLSTRCRRIPTSAMTTAATSRTARTISMRSLPSMQASVWA